MAKNTSPSLVLKSIPVPLSIQGATKPMLVTTADAVVSCLTPNKETVGEMQTSIQTYHMQASVNVIPCCLALFVGSPFP